MSLIGLSTRFASAMPSTIDPTSAIPAETATITSKPWLAWLTVSNEVDA